MQRSRTAHRILTVRWLEVNALYPAWDATEFTRVDYDGRTFYRGTVYLVANPRTSYVIHVPAGQGVIYTYLEHVLHETLTPDGEDLWLQYIIEQAGANLPNEDD